MTFFLLLLSFVAGFHTHYYGIVNKVPGRKCSLRQFSHYSRLCRKLILRVGMLMKADKTRNALETNDSLMTSLSAIS